MGYQPGIVPGSGVMPEFLAREFRRISTELGAIAARDTVRYVTAPTTLEDADDLLVVSASASTNISLPPLSISLGRKVTVKKVDASISALVVLVASGSETIDGQGTRTLSAQYQFLTLTGGTGDWHIIGR